MVVPIKGNIHCTGVSAARQRNRRRDKTKFKVLGEGLGYISTQRLNCRGYQARLSALSNKETSEERDLPLASEVAWETTEVVRKARMRRMKFVGKLQAPKLSVPAGGRGHDH